MKNLEKFIADVKVDEQLAKKFHESLNKFRTDENISAIQAALCAAKELGYEISEEEAIRFSIGFENKSFLDKQPLSDDELDAVAGGTWDTSWDNSW